MVFALRPDSRATLRKETPSSAGGGGYGDAVGPGAEACGSGAKFAACEVLPKWKRRARARIFSNGRTSAVRPREVRKFRREEDKSNRTFPGWARAKICRCFVL